MTQTLKKWSDAFIVFIWKHRRYGCAGWSRQSVEETWKRPSKKRAARTRPSRKREIGEREDARQRKRAGLPRSYSGRLRKGTFCQSSPAHPRHLGPALSEDMHSTCRARVGALNGIETMLH
ncbi:hypothetical protein OE88DRAFT_363419 [Heliocybe sulcata]|uniref:Uncharacterized protein n=1 Tax=Heliocybe sulcata TaxID=5364 RepID=A0A5C3N790_9AGAM|nr:hypothetical protein OE88DRAFT_363419 [Heliocybe sulcata]